MFDKPLSDAVGSIQNVVIFICDSLRYDHLPSNLSNKGVLTKAIAPSTYTASSVPSMFSGVYPSDHSVFDFRSTLSGGSVFEYWDNSVYETKHMFDWPVTAVNAENGPNQLSELEWSEPFLYVRHHLGGHAPYGRTVPSEWDSTKQYYDQYNKDEHQQRYSEGILQSINNFNDLLNKIKQKGLFKSTLFIFVSDHGELLGDRGGIWGHGNAITPELVEVPMVFIGDGLPGGEKYARLLSGIDIAPTVSSIHNNAIPSYMQGTDLFNSIPPEKRRVRSELWNRKILDRMNYAATSMWDDDGGYVSRVESWLQHMLFIFVHELFVFNSISVRRRVSLSPTEIRELYTAITPREIEYGSPSFSYEDIHDQLPEYFVEGSNPTAEIDHEQLRRLGYIS